MTHNIDKIIYINLNKREDRKLSIENELEKYGFKNYERFEAIETKGFGIVGCTMSHLSVLKIAKERNYKNILILEDDFVFSVNKTKFDILLDGFFQLEIPFDVCMLSYNMIQNKPTEYSIINQVVEAQAASGYIVNNHYYDTLINLYEKSFPLLETTKQHWIYANDQIWKQLQKKDLWYYFVERIGKQIAGYSDIGEQYTENNW
uniref:Glycosyl transferase family 25 domain-containing protein n=1 Tax=viral metagenome TaxID=1070528 RepID=A0A6C0IDS7_9ZZZZ